MNLQAHTVAESVREAVREKPASTITLRASPIDIRHPHTERAPWSAAM